jgi:hypothetical protein
VALPERHGEETDALAASPHASAVEGSGSRGGVGGEVCGGGVQAGSVGSSRDREGGDECGGSLGGGCDGAPASEYHRHAVAAVTLVPHDATDEASEQATGGEAGGDDESRRLGGEGNQPAAGPPRYPGERRGGDGLASCDAGASAGAARTVL